MAQAAPPGHHGLRWAELRRALGPALRRLVFAGLLPVLAFYVVLRLQGPVPGILAGTTTGLAILWLRTRQMGRLDPVVIVAMLAVLFQGCVGLVTGSVWAYFAAPAVENLLWGTALCGSVLVGQPLIGLIATELHLVPGRFRGHPSAERAFRLLTLMWGVGAYLKVVFRLALLAREVSGGQSVEFFLVVHTIGNSAINLALMVASFALPLRWLRHRQ